MKVKYTYVPPCPRCGSVHTGRYISQAIMMGSLIDTEKQALKKGELVRISGVPLSEMEVNLFCDDCGVEWMGKTTTLWLDKKEIEEIKARENITEDDFNRFKKNKKSSLKRFIDSFKIGGEDEDRALKKKNDL